jgi:D-3-phosphoglycerate dehydrogenase
MRVLVTESLSERGLEVLREDFDVDVREELAKGDLVGEIAPYDALVVRSATQVTADVIEAAEHLKVVARAGIGLDNVDVDAATRRGIMVLNAPQSNIVSAAEHTVALLLAQARWIPQAGASLKAGEVQRRRTAGQDPRPRRSRTGRVAGRPADAGFRDAGHRL